MSNIVPEHGLLLGSSTLWLACIFNKIFCNSFWLEAIAGSLKLTSFSVALIENVENSFREALSFDVISTAFEVILLDDMVILLDSSVKEEHDDSLFSWKFTISFGSWSSGHEFYNEDNKSCFRTKNLLVIVDYNLLTRRNSLSFEENFRGKVGRAKDGCSLNKTGTFGFSEDPLSTRSKATEAFTCDIFWEK